MFTQQNTTGYSAEELDLLNAELADQLEGIDPNSPEGIEIEKYFADEVASR